MDVDSLRAELEAQLAKISHKDAPHGFRDRFDRDAECYLEEQDEARKAGLEEELRQIRDEAEACAKAHAGDDAPEPKPRPEPPRAEPAPQPRPRPEPGPDPAPDAPGFFQRYGIAAGIVVVIVLAAAYFYFR